MAIKVIVKGDSSGDYEFIVKAFRKERCFNEEILELLDSSGNLLYTIPTSSLNLIQYIQDESQVQMQEFVDGEYITQLCVENGVSDIAIDCTRVNADRFINLPVIEAYQYLGIDNATKQEKWFKEFSIPLSKIKFINHNFVINTDNNSTSSKILEDAIPQNAEETIAPETPPVENKQSSHNSNPKKKKSKFNKK